MPAVRASSARGAATEVIDQTGGGRAFSVLFEDDDLVVVNKAAGVLTVPTLRRERNTLVDLVARHVRHATFVVHRLDRDTSGVIVLAKTRAVRDALSSAIAARKAERVYVALVHGVIEDDTFTARSRLTTRRNLDRVSGPRGELAVTHVHVRRRGADATLVEARLETGRRNQIRVHLQERGHPILGDARYARGRTHPAWPPNRLALHAERLAFAHPRTAEELVFTAPLPAAFARFIAKVVGEPRARGGSGV